MLRKVLSNEKQNIVSKESSRLQDSRATPSLIPPCLSFHDTRARQKNINFPHPLVQTTLRVGTGVDEVGVVERQLHSTVDNVVSGLNTQHKGVVLVADLVLPAAEAATRVDVLGLQLGQELCQHAVALKGGCGVTMVEFAVVGGNDLILGQDHLGVDEALNTVLEQALLVNGLHGRLRNLQHDGPVRTLLCLGRIGLLAVGLVQSRQLGVLLGLVVRGVVGEDGGTVEGAVVLREVELYEPKPVSACHTANNLVGRG